MAQPAWLSKYLKMKPEISRLFQDLESYLAFCQSHGYRFNESDLYNFKSYAWQQYNKYSQGKSTKNMWVEDARRFAGHRSA